MCPRKARRSLNPSMNNERRDMKKKMQDKKIDICQWYISVMVSYSNKQNSIGHTLYFVWIILQLFGNNENIRSGLSSKKTTSISHAIINFVSLTFSPWSNFNRFQIFQNKPTNNWSLHHQKKVFKQCGIERCDCSRSSRFYKTVLYMNHWSQSHRLHYSSRWWV